jgi:hypothetical protein
MSSNTETKLADLLITLRDSANTANQVADQIEQALIAIYASEGAKPSDIPPRTDQATREAQTEEKHKNLIKVGAKFNPNILDLVRGDPFIWDMSPESILDYKDYCFVEVVAKSETGIGFKFISSALGKVILTQHYDKEVYDLMKVGEIYVCHNIRKGRKLHWDAALHLIGYTREQCVSKAKALARIFAEQK